MKRLIEIVKGKIKYEVIIIITKLFKMLKDSSLFSGTMTMLIQHIDKIDGNDYLWKLILREIVIICKLMVYTYIY
jgi:hypothetical protein